jgi:hypothetical protein
VTKWSATADGACHVVLLLLLLVGLGVGTRGDPRLHLLHAATTT